MPNFDLPLSSFEICSPKLWRSAEWMFTFPELPVDAYVVPLGCKETDQALPSFNSRSRSHNVALPGSEGSEPCFTYPSWTPMISPVFMSHNFITPSTLLNNACSPEADTERETSPRVCFGKLRMDCPDVSHSWIPPSADIETTVSFTVHDRPHMVSWCAEEYVRGHGHWRLKII